MELFGTCTSDEKFNIETAAYIDNFQHKDLVIWGMGESLNLFIDIVKHRMNIKYIVDRNWKNFAQKIGGGQI